MDRSKIKQYTELEIIEFCTTNKDYMLISRIEIIEKYIHSILVEKSIECISLKLLDTMYSLKKEYNQLVKLNVYIIPTKD